MWKNTYTISRGFAWIALTALLVPARAAELEREIEAVDARVVTWRRDFHRNPELSNREVRTAKIVEDHLKKLGLEVRTGIAKTGVLGVLKTGRPGPVIALRADMDALPVTERVDVPFKSLAKSNYRGEEVGVMHACGHDSHIAVLMGVAEALTKRKADLRGTVLFVFQPAEEGAPPGEEGGASVMLREGVFKDYKPEAMFGWHAWSSMNTGQIGYRSGPFFADSHAWRAVITGRQAHGSAPWKGVDPIVVSAQIVNAMQTVVSRQTDITEIPAAFSVGIIKGGVRNNIIPDTVELIGTLRTFSPGQKSKIVANAKRLFEKTAEASGATATFELNAYYNPVTVNDPKLTAKMLPSLNRVAGETNVREVPLVTGAEDFAYFAREIPSFYFAIGVTPAGQDAVAAPVNHSPLFYLDEKALPLATRALTAIAVDYLK
jgi:amidohydrolase